MWFQMLHSEDADKYTRCSDREVNKEQQVDGGSLPEVQWATCLYR